MPRKPSYTPTETLVLLENWMKAVNDIVHHIASTRGPHAPYYYHCIDQSPWPIQATKTLQRDTECVIEYLKKRHALGVRGPLEHINRAAKIWTEKQAAISGFSGQHYEDSHAAEAAARTLSEFAEDGLPEQRRLNLDLRIAEGAVLRARFPLLAECFGREQPFLIRRHLIQWASWVVKAYYEVIRDWPLPDDRELAALAKEGGGAYCGSVESRERCELAQVVMPPYIPNIDETPKKLAVEEARRAGDMAVVLPLINELDAEIEAFVNEAACWPRTDVGPSRTERVFQAANRLGDLVGSESGLRSQPVGQLRPSHTKPTRAGGRPTVSEKETRRRIHLVKQWNQAKAIGVRQKDFCSDQDVLLEYLTKCINWLAQRRRRDHQA